jgi:hypothetical protein
MTTIFRRLAMALLVIAGLSACAGSAHAISFAPPLPKDKVPAIQALRKTESGAGMEFGELAELKLYSTYLQEYHKGVKSAVKNHWDNVRKQSAKKGNGAGK